MRWKPNSFEKLCVFSCGGSLKRRPVSSGMSMLFAIGAEFWSLLKLILNAVLGMSRTKSVVFITSKVTDYLVNIKTATNCSYIASMLSDKPYILLLITRFFSHIIWKSKCHRVLNVSWSREWSGWKDILLHECLIDWMLDIILYVFNDDVNDAMHYDEYSGGTGTTVTDMSRVSRSGW